MTAAPTMARIIGRRFARRAAIPRRLDLDDAALISTDLGLTRRLDFSSRRVRSASAREELAVSALIASQFGTPPGLESGIGSTTGMGGVRRVSASATATGAGVDGVRGACVGGGVLGAGVTTRGDDVTVI